MAELLVPISPGELIDKITILEIKSARMTDAAKLHNVRTELTLLNETWRASAFSAVDITAEWTGLRDVNGQLWDIEDRIRDKERESLFDAEFIELARAVYVTNDERAAIKRRINTQARVGPGGREELQGIQEVEEGQEGQEGVRDYLRHTTSLATWLRQLIGITTGRSPAGSSTAFPAPATTVGTEIAKSLPRSRRTVPAMVLATSPTRSHRYSCETLLSFIFISSTVSMPRGAEKQTMPLRRPDTAMTPL